jgi:uncharacterized protein (TIGR00369 family)
MTLLQLRDSLTSVPFNTLLGLRLHRVHRDGITIDCTLRNDLRNDAGVAHGGIAAAMADATVGGAIQPHFGGGRRITTVELKINYFLPVTEGRIFAGSHPLRIGSTLCVGNVDLTGEHGRAIGTAIVTYMFINPSAVRTSHPRPPPACRGLGRVLVASRVPHAGSSSSCCSSRVNLFDRDRRYGEIERRHQCRLSWTRPIP